MGLVQVNLQDPGTLNYTVVGFVPNPDGRGTLSLLFSCLLTLSLCVWSAVHLNLPRYGESESQYAYRYFKWSVLGVFGPELVIFAAWRQYISAQSLTRAVKEESHPASAIAAQHWTMTHSFYAGMGGFAFDLAAPELVQDGPFITPGQRRLYLSPRGVQLLAKCGLLPTTTLRDIKDKSKTDTSGKFVCCIQVGWMFIQAISRVVVGLPVTPLETNTIAHVFCALINYILWWNKPRWIREPTILTGEWTRCVCAFMFMSSQISAANRVDRDLLRDFGVEAEIAGVLYVRDGAYGGRLKRKATAAAESNSDSDGKLAQHLEFTESKMSSKQQFPQFAAQDKSDNAVLRQRRWHLACEAVARFPAIRERLAPPPCDEEEARYREALRLYPEMPDKISDHFKSQMKASRGSVLFHRPEANGLVFSPEELVVDRPRNWPGDELLRQMQGHLVGIILWSSSTVYGAIHLAGWNEHFPSVIEQWIWRGSGAYLVFSGLLWSLLNLMGHLSGTVWWFWYNILAASKRTSIHVILYILCSIGGTLYVVARLYLVLEAFVSLRALPAAAYASPNWVLSFPHF